jgi:hypothetical protein
MSLTRPRLSQLNTSITAFKDPITVINAGSSQANVDMGFLYNRANGMVSNVALYWSESGNTFVTAFTANTGATDSNILVSNYANLTVGTLAATSVSTTGNLYVGGNLTVANLITVNQEVVTTTEVIQGNIVADSGTSSTSTTTGALVVRGGAGIGGDMYISGNIVPAANITYDLGSSTSWFRDLWLSAGTIHIGGARITQDPDTGAVAIVPKATAANPNPVATVFTPAGTIVTANTVAGTVSTANIVSSTTSSNFSNLTANSATIANDVTIGGNLTITGNLSVANAMLDRGSAGSNWDSILLMGTYLVNRVSWSGTTGTPTDSMNYTGILEVLNSGSTALTQNYRPYDASTVAKNFWTRTKFSTNSWSSWVEVTNNTSQLDGGSF